MDYKNIEQKWQKAWSDAKVYEVEPNEKKPFLVTAAFPYVNSPQHMGHIRTYGTADTYSRYQRMKGFNVLYPMAFHASGVPLIAFAKRIRNNDQDLIEELRIFHVPDSEIRQMVDPRYMASYFIKEMESGMLAAGYGIDWRREFVSIEPIFSRFVEWQFFKLKEKGYITKGKHPVGWCTNEQQAVGQHDTKHDVQPEIEQITVVKLKDKDSDIYFGCATYRPETIYGVTNIFINKNGKYLVANIDGFKYYISKEALESLKYQFDVKVENEVSTEDLLKKVAINPIDGSEVPVLPGFFVKDEIGTGIVMSVPAHAPFDYIALQRLKKDNYPVPQMEYKKVVEIEKKNGIGIGRSLADTSSGEAKPEHPEIPALAYLEVLHTNEDAIDDMIEFATKLIYREESHWGFMLVGDYKGMKEQQARDLIKKKLVGSKDAFEMHIIANDEPVYCRCGTRVIVKVADQWFINYGDKGWKELARKALKETKIYPEKLRLTFENVLEWLDLRATERKQGLGTAFPFDKSSTIESLSDSTLYMTFYTYVHILKSEKIKPEQLEPIFFDFVILSIGDADKVQKATGIDAHVVRRCKESFEYWYTDTSRHSGPDLIPNHFMMYIFNHACMLEEKYWPKRIVVNGFVNYEGEKMSKSLGNIVPLIDGINKYGADPIRFIEIAGADLDTDTEFSSDGINSIHSRNEFIYKTIMSLPNMKSKELSHMDYWLYSKLNSKIKSATQFMDSINLKNAYTEIYYNSVNELKRYMERKTENQIVVREYLEQITLMLAPIMPHVAEEFWSCLDKKTLIVQEKWPEVDESMISKEEEKMEELVDNVQEDVRQGIELTSKININNGKSIKEIKLIVADQWKAKAYSALTKTKNIGKTMASDELDEVDKEKLSKFVAQFAKKIATLNESEEINMDLFRKALMEAKDFMEERFKTKIEIELESNSKSERAQRSLPEKPGIDIVWD
jgi:leucyl-tRNA synthetase